MLYAVMGRVHGLLALAYDAGADRVRRIRRLAGESGQGTVEYVGLILLVSLLMVGMVAAMKGFKKSSTRARASALTPLPQRRLHMDRQLDRTFMLIRHKRERKSAMTATNEEFGARIKEIRERTGFTQVELASQLGMSQSGLSRLEDGSRAITARQLVEIGEKLGVPLAQLVGDEAPTEAAQLRAGEANDVAVTESLRVFVECIDQFRGVQALAG